MNLDFIYDCDQDSYKPPIKYLIDCVNDNAFWGDYLLRNVACRPIRVAIHLGVFVEPFLQFVLDGKKTVESRFSINECPPYGVVQEGDVLLVKQAGGPILAISRILRVWSYQVDDSAITELRSLFGEAMCADSDEFWESKSAARCATLMQLGDILPISALKIDKQDKRGWVVLQERSQQMLLWDD